MQHESSSNICPKCDQPMTGMSVTDGISKAVPVCMRQDCPPLKTMQIIQMTVWDHYAAAPLTGLVSIGCDYLATPDMFIKSVCSEASQFADAMMAERKKRMRLI